MPKPIPVSTFKIFRHNFLTNEWSRFLYEGHYYPFKESHIGKVSLSKKKAKTFWIKFIIPNVWLSEYTRGVYFPINQFPNAIRVLLKKCDKTKDKKLEAKAFEQIRKYFVKKMTITKKQAKVLMKLQLSEISIKRAHAIHKRIGLP